MFSPESVCPLPGLHKTFSRNFTKSCRNMDHTLSTWKSAEIRTKLSDPHYYHFLLIIHFISENVSKTYWLSLRKQARPDKWKNGVNDGELNYDEQDQVCQQRSAIKTTANRNHCLTPSTSCLTPLMPAVPNCCCSKGSAPQWSNPPFLISDIRALWRSVLSARVPECQKLKMVG